MEEAINRSSEAQKDAADGNSRPPNEGKDENRDGKVEENEGQRKVSGTNSSDCTVDNATTGEKGELRASPPETLPSVQLSGSDFRFDESSHLLSEVPVEYSLQPLESAEEVKMPQDLVSIKDKEPSKGIINGQSAQVQILNETQVPDDPSRLELSPTSVTQSISSVPSPTMTDRKLRPVENGSNTCHTEQDKQNSPDPKLFPAVPIKVPSDGYNWRKYGQKQVKSPEGSRSYYRCTFSDCCAKKIECSDRSNRIIETVYRSHHNHDPPHKTNCSRENKPKLPVVPFNGSSDAILPERGHNDQVPSPHPKEPLPATDLITETKQDSNGSEETMEINVKEECVDGPEYKRRLKRCSTDEVDTLPNHGKKPKFVVHAAGDVGISGDGYRWRKYGQKMVKGNPHPRNYYRCTSAGCPVRKHIERAVDNTNALVITYKGVHDHDTPVPRKRHAPKNTPLPAISPVSAENLQANETEPQRSQAQRSLGKESELSGEELTPIGEKTSDSTRTLLSIGFEIKPC